MPDTFHLGDCSTDCDTCKRICAAGNHEDCTGTPEQRKHADKLQAAHLEALGPALREYFGYEA